MNRKVSFIFLLIALATLLSACRDAVEGNPVTTKNAENHQVTAAMEDLAGRLGVRPDEITLVLEKNVTWRDGSLGCPKPDMMYTQSLVPGTLIVLRVNDAKYEYHSGGGRAPFYCENPVSPAPKSSLD